ncbi:MAG: PAS domain S-box protein [Hormoscilla sp.]
MPAIENRETELALRTESRWVLPDRGEMYDRIIETTKEGSLLLSPEGNTAFVNGRMTEMLGYSSSAMLRIPLLMLIDEEYQQQAAENLLKCRQGLDREMELKFRHRDGSEVWANLSTNSIFDAGDIYAGVLVIVTNITEQKRAEEKLHASRRQQQALNLITQAIRSSIDLEIIFSTAVSEMLQVLQAEYVHIFQYLYESHLWLNIAESRSHPALPATLGREIHAGALPAKVNSIVRSDDNDIDTDQLAETFTGTWLLVPLHLGVSVWGGIIIVMPSDAYEWQDSEIEWLRTVANQLDMGLNQAVLYQQLAAAHQELKRWTAFEEISNPVTTILRGEELKKKPAGLESGPNSTAGLRRPFLPEESLLMSYVAYYLSRGKTVLSLMSGPLAFEGKVYDYQGYHEDFQYFWQQLQQRRDFRELYLEGDSYCFGNFLEGSCTVSECARCQIPIPMPSDPAWSLPSCPCDLEGTGQQDRQQEKGLNEVELTQVLAIGALPNNCKNLDKWFARNGFAVTFVSQPEEIIPQSLPDTIDMVLIHAEVSSVEGKAWAQKLRRHPQLNSAPIVALSAEAGQSMNWVERDLGVEDYLLTPLGGDRLAAHLRGCSQSQLSFAGTELHWFPR